MRVTAKEGGRTQMCVFLTSRGHRTVTIMIIQDTNGCHLSLVLGMFYSFFPLVIRKRGHGASRSGWRGLWSNPGAGGWRKEEKCNWVRPTLEMGTHSEHMKTHTLGSVILS